MAVVAAVDQLDAQSTVVVDGVPLYQVADPATVGASTLVMTGASPPGLGSALHELATALVAEYATCWIVRDVDVWRPIPKRYLEVIKESYDYQIAPAQRRSGGRRALTSAS